jgi:hypothetical protein
MNTSNIETISDLYKNLTYFDSYGGSLLLFIFITYITVSLIIVCYIKINSQPVIDNWAKYRCKPYIIPFAGFITHPEGVTALDYTAQNFNYCTQTISQNIMGEMLSPLTFITNLIQNIIKNLSAAINDIRQMFDKLRTSFSNIAKNIFDRIISITIPLREIIISFRDMLSKTQGVMTAALYTFLGSYFAMKSVMGVIAKMIISILTILAALIAVFWLSPFSWGFAIANTAIFVAISIPMAIILAFMTEVMQVNSGLKIPKLKCFDKDTLIKMNDGSKNRISDIKIGDVLADNNVITALFKVETKGSQMYFIDNILVSDSHIIKYKNTWIPVSKHPDAKKYAFYDKPYLYCLNTSKKIIHINSQIFSDWDEICEDNLSIIKNKHIMPIENMCDIHTYLDGGFIGDTPIILKNGKTVKIKDINIGSILLNGEIVYGIVQIDGKTISHQYKYILDDINDKYVIGSQNLVINDKNNQNKQNNKNSKKSVLDLEINKKIQLMEKEDILYHLLTDKTTFSVENTVFYDYNAGIDTCLEK